MKCDRCGIDFEADDRTLVIAYRRKSERWINRGEFELCPACEGDYWAFCRNEDRQGRLF